MVINKNKAFCADLEKLSGDRIDKTERELVDAALGRGAVKYKLTPAGFQSLFKALANEGAQRTGPRK